MILDITQLILAISMIAVILLQNRGAGLGAGFGGEGAVYTTKRGVEKKLHTITIIIGILFFGVALANVLF